MDGAGVPATNGADQRQGKRRLLTKGMHQLSGFVFTSSIPPSPEWRDTCPAVYPQNPSQDRQTTHFPLYYPGNEQTSQQSENHAEEEAQTLGGLGSQAGSPPVPLLLKTPGLGFEHPGQPAAQPPAPSSLPQWPAGAEGWAALSVRTCGRMSPQLCWDAQSWQERTDTAPWREARHCSQSPRAAR